MDRVLEAAERVAQQTALLEQYQEFLDDAAFVLGDEGGEAHELAGVIRTLTTEVVTLQEALRQQGQQ